MLTFTNLEIRILKEEERGYPVELTVDGAQQFQGGYLNGDLLPWVASASPSQDGERLFNWLLGDERLGRAWAQIRGQNARRRVRLRIDAAAPELHTLPWELLRDPNPELTPQTLAADAHTPFSRYLAGQWAPGGAIADRPLKLLVAIANPDGLEEYGLSEIDVEREKAIIQEALAGIGREVLEVSFLTETVSLPRLGLKLKKGVHLLHLIAHGMYSQKKETASLYLADEDDDVRLIKTEEFAEMLGRLERLPQLIFLASCQTASRSPADAFRGFAPRLIAAGVPAVVAMQDLVVVETAQAFSRTFYQQLLAHGEVDLACNEARGGVLEGALPGESIPVLFSRLPENRLFDLSGGGAAVQPAYPPPPEPTRPPEMGEFVGRQAELNYYADKLKESHLAVISGMPGVGKTALAIALAEIWQVWQMSQRRTSHAVPDLSIADTEVDEWLVAKNEVFWHAFHQDEGLMTVIWQLAGFLAWHGQDDLWRMLHAAQQSGGQPPPADALLDYVLKLIQGQGYLLCLDDVQYVHEDPMLVQFIDRLRELIQAGEVSLILTSREVPDYIRTASFEPLGGLSAADVGRIAASRGLSLTDDWLAELHAHTEGNAELLTLAINVLQRADDPEQVLSCLAEVTDIERYLVKEVDDGLSEDDREVMVAVAILLGYPGSRDALETVSSRRRLKRLLLTLSDRYLLTRHELEGDEAYSSHAIVRAFYYDLPGRRERRQLHRLAGEYYEQEEPDPLRAALHYERAGEYEKAAGLATADIWKLINQGQARPLSRLLARFTAEQLDPLSWAAVKIAQGQVGTLLGQGQSAQESYQQALVSLASCPDEPAIRHLKADAYKGISDALRYQSPQEALAWLQRGLHEFADLDSQTEAALRIKMGIVQINTGDFSQALRSLEQALNLLPQGPGHWRATALVNLGNVHYYLGNSQAGNDYTRKALEISEQLHDYFRIVGILNNLGIDHYLAGEWEQAVVVLRQALAQAEKLGNVKRQLEIELSLGNIYLFQGADEAASGHLSNCLRLAQAHNLKVHQVWAKSNLADLHLRWGEPEVAAPLLAEAEQEALALELKDRLPEIYSRWAQVYLAQGKPEQALADAEKSVKLARELEMELEADIALRDLAQALWANNQSEAALTTFEQSLSLLADQAPYEAARTQLAWGRCLVSGPDVAQGTTLLEEARATFEQLGAKRDLAQVEAWLA